jgi:hypothetical protein
MHPEQALLGACLAALDEANKGVAVYGAWCVEVYDSHPCTTVVIRSDGREGYNLAITERGDALDEHATLHSRRFKSVNNLSIHLLSPIWFEVNRDRHR